MQKITRRRWAVFLFQLTLLFTVCTAAIVVSMTVRAARATGQQPCGKILVDGLTWAGDFATPQNKNEFDVHSNGPDEGTSASCVPDTGLYNLHPPTGIAPRWDLGWQSHNGELLAH